MTKGRLTREELGWLLTQEAQDLARRSHHRGVANAFALQFESLRAIHRSDVRAVFDGAALRAAQPTFDYNSTYQRTLALNTSFDVTLPAEALGMRPGQREGRPDSGVIDPADHGYRHVGDDVSLEAGLQHPPPFDPRHLEQIRAWQRRRFGL